MVIIAYLRVIHCIKDSNRNGRKRTKEIIRRCEEDEELESDLGRDAVSSGVQISTFLKMVVPSSRRVRVFENWVLRRIFGPKRDEVTGEWRKLHNEELNPLNTELNPTCQ